MHFFGALDTASSLPVRANLKPRTDNRTQRVCRTIGSFAVYMHDYGLDQFDSRLRDDAACWNVSAYNTSETLLGNCTGNKNRQYTWWCNKRPNNPCVHNCPNQVTSCLEVFRDMSLHKLVLPPALQPLLDLLTFVSPHPEQSFPSCTFVLRCLSVSLIPQDHRFSSGQVATQTSTGCRAGQTIQPGLQLGS